MSEKRDIRSLSYGQLRGTMENIGEKPFRADQIFDWLHNKKVSDFSLMTNVSKKITGKLSQDFEIYETTPVRVLVSGLDGTRKYIHRLHDKNVIETVLLKYDYGNTVCISSQVGCRMGCRFCASTIDGLARNLTAGEMAGQVYSVENDIGERVSHIVVMGSGEPLDNYDNFTDFIELINDKKGANISGRNITACNCGIVPKMYELAERKYAITLALSLHATTDEKRRQIMPIANKYSLEEILDACRYYFDRTGRRITFEYSLIEGVNDTDEDIEGLIRIAGSVTSHINLIPVNPIAERKYRATSPQAALALKNKLEKNHINVTIRREMGRDISASCGQLRRSFIKDADTGDQNA